MELSPENGKIIFAVLTHPRMINLRKQFRRDLLKTLADRQAVEKVANIARVQEKEMADKGWGLARVLPEIDATWQDSVEQHAGTALAFCLSQNFMSFWGHFTSSLSKLIRDDRFLGDISVCCGKACPPDQVLRAIREFSDPSKMPIGKAGV
ncbi:MAG: hypothetical protein KW788_03470 [Candidatus Doudnabacteria bacterium]|nr:hypothetical protein [Candidatus Doudnabacteria bacterium]